MKRSDWISILALFISIIACIITWLRIEVYTTNDTFVGLMAGFMGACATIIVGFQIFSYIDSNKKVKELESIQLKLNKEVVETRKERERSEHLMKYGVNLASGLSLYHTQPFTAYICYFKGLIEALEAHDHNSINKALNNLEFISNLVKNHPNKIYSEDPGITSVEGLKVESLNKYEYFPIIYKRYFNTYTEIIKSIERLYS